MRTRKRYFLLALEIGAGMKKILAGALIALGFSGQAFAADAYNWTGFYVGGNVGYGWGKVDTRSDTLPSPAAFGGFLIPSSLDFRTEGFFGGGQIGYNLQTNRIVWGVEADIQGSGIDGSVWSGPTIATNNFIIPGYRTSGERLTWFGTVRGRIGFALTDTFQFYTTGGLAYGNVEYSSNSNFSFLGNQDYPSNVSKTKVGWTLGGGGEWAVANNWSVKLEYLYIDLGDERRVADGSPANPPFQIAYSSKTQEHTLRAGLNYKFGGPAFTRY